MKNLYLVIKNNKIFIGFHPLLEKLKDENIILANAKCGQYLPSWRLNTDYSAKKEEGGGVLLDLSHEIDYVQWLCGRIKVKINSDDLTMLIGKTNKNIFVNISIDYISKNTHRRLLVETYELDFISNKLVKKNKTGLEEIYNFSNYMFEKMHLDIFNQQKNICTFKEALDVMDTIQEQNR